MSDRPAAEVRLGRIKAVIWANAGEDGERWHTVQLTRLYRDEDGQWRSTHGFRRDDLLLVAKVADLAHSKVCELAAANPAREAAAEAEPPSEA
ncbi:MAG: hypothetical protein OXH69_23220 [Acidobacteria bacterium]|nr:hypothetical protein [Acidobacteriota bacterium]